MISLDHEEPTLIAFRRGAKASRRVSCSTPTNHLTEPTKFDWEERFYEALLGGRDPRENYFAAEWIVYTRLSETVPMSNEERSAIDHCLSDLRRFQMQELNYPPIGTFVQNTNLRSDEDLIEKAFLRHRGKANVDAGAPFFPAQAAGGINDEDEFQRNGW